MIMNDVDFDGIGNLVEVKLNVDEKVIKETLTRIGIVNKARKILYPSCYLVQNFDKYYIFHFKELFSVTRSNWYNNISAEDIERKNAIVFCLKNWGMIDVDLSTIEPHNMFVFVLPHNLKSTYVINHKFNISAIEDAS